MTTTTTRAAAAAAAAQTTTTTRTHHYMLSHASPFLNITYSKRPSKFYSKPGHKKLVLI